MNTLLALPLLIPFGGLVVCLCLWRAPAAHRWLALAATSVLLAISIVLLWQVWTNGIQVTRVGDWPAPFGIVLVADLLSAMMLTLVAAAALAVTVYSSAAADPARVAFGYYPVFLALVTGLSGAFLTGDIFNLYVWFELVLIASFVLMTLGGEPDQIAAGIKYVALSLVASFFLLSATGLLYGLAGTLNMADLAVRLRASPEVGPIAIVSMLFLVAFAIKAAVFPMFAWLPASYPAPPAGISAFFAGSLTKLGIYAMIRCFTLLFTGDSAYLHTVLLWLAGATMLAGVIGAISQRDLRNMLSYQIVGHIGYVLMGLALFTPLALAGAIFYLVHEVIAKTALFLTTGLIARSTGTTEISRLGGLYAARPVMAALFLIPALSISGFPPLSGFFPKLMLVRAGLDVQGYVIAAIALVASLLTLYAVARVWVDGFWMPQTSGAPALRPHWALWAPCWFLTGLTVAIGFAAGPVFSLSERAAAELLNPDAYVQAVIGLE